jgi:hypothetical protein
VSFAKEVADARATAERALQRFKNETLPIIHSEVMGKFNASSMLFADRGNSSTCWTQQQSQTTSASR